MQNNNFINYPYLAGVLTSKLQMIAGELLKQGLLKDDKLDEAIAIAYKEIADAEEFERQYTQRWELIDSR